MFYIKTLRGWRPLHKQHYELAKLWCETGRDVEEKVSKLTPSDHWVTERNFKYIAVMERLIYSARQRAKKRSIAFSIGLTDFEIPAVCPLRGVPFRVGTNHHTDDSPSLDRKDPRFGYVKGNVWVISHKANRLKGDFTPDELRTFCENALALNWVAWTSDDEAAANARHAEWKRRRNETYKSRWWALWSAGNSK